MKVIHILNSLLPSGAETMLKVAGAEWRDCDSHILATHKDIGEYAVELENAGYKIHHIYHSNVVLQHLGVIKFLKDGHFDVAHIHRESQSTLYELDAKTAGVKRIVRTVHNVFPKSKKRKIARGLANLIGVKEVAIGKSVYENERKYFITPHYLIRNWCDESIFTYCNKTQQQIARNELGIPKDRMCVVSVGNCNDIKNHDFIINAVKQINSDQICYYHIGSGKLEETEKELVNKYELGDKVFFLGRCKPRKYLEAADLYVMPSKFEGLSISALEALLSGVHVLFTDVEGLKDFKEIDTPEIHMCSLKQDEFTQVLEHLFTEWKNGLLEHSEIMFKKASQIYNMKKSVAEYQKVYASSNK